jgi:sterol desaturase/sphingolipid hydroxylase (fatty acid hydroxylase superfamily)
VLAAAALWFEEHYGHLALRVGGEWPVWARVLLALLFSDFLAWFHHLLRHRIPLFWAFHQVHHSQRDMNYFTDFRLHPLDLIIANLIVLLPQLLLQVDAPTIVLLGILLQWHTVLYHCNLRTNYGPLRYLLVTPQSHRVHHSQQPEHCDRNYGVIFSIWDRIFGTQHGDAQVYPATGVDTAFPVESSLGEVLSLRALGRQMLFPFRRRPPP